MRAGCLLILVLLTVFSIQCQNIPSDSGGENPTLEEVLQRAEAHLIRSFLQKKEEDESADDHLSAPEVWLIKRQHPGKRQHPSKREEKDYEEEYAELQRRQHPGKREDESDLLVELERRQHLGRRSELKVQTSIQNKLLSELSKRQHPGKRYNVYDKRQHPGKREVEEGAASAVDSWELDKRQHPGKRFWDPSEVSTGGPCNVPGCINASLLLQLLNEVKQSRANEKRQHPGKRLEALEDMQ